ncbi:hypothetical protein FA95DRAFT_1601510 [Auriscalpium vulgare]|uniref:Uncharacterized protein n=1 Tax=Auriscalpium vulgare TaxID=40419 RepID=A0ACB8S935_9AGAM|nr:hypothetical protein FA95DRAFT_1601510 [Auriscalpium vulgare]
MPTDSMRSNRGPIKGIQLWSPGSGDEPSQTLYFYKARTNTIMIGRTSSSTATKERAGDSATFRCPVISRRHAKIAFHAAGHVYIVDLSSHHGTHVLKQGETVSKMLAPGVPVSLDNGDIITFGKSVGKDDFLVRPVTVHVKLLHDEADKGKQSVRSRSGRYGVYSRPSPSPIRSVHTSPSCSPWSSFSSPSDVEESDRPEEYPIVRSQPFEGLPSLNRLGLLKHLIPPMHAPQPFSPYQSPVVSGSRHNSVNHWPYPDDIEAFPSSTPPSLLNPLDASIDCADAQEPVDEPLVIGAFPNSRAVSPSHTAQALRIISISPDPESPAEEVPSVAQQAERVDAAEMDVLDDIINAAIEAAGLPREESVEPLPPPSDAQVMALPVAEGTTGNAADGPPMEARIGALNDALVNLRVRGTHPRVLQSLMPTLLNMQGSVLRVHIAHRKTQNDQKAQADRAISLDHRIDETNALFESLKDHVEDSSHVLRDELVAFRERMDSAERAIESLNTSDARRDDGKYAPSSSDELASLSEREDVKASVAELHALVHELTSLRQSATVDLGAELAALKAARVQAEAHRMEIDDMVQTAAAASASLKRKRSEADDEVEVTMGKVDTSPPTKRSRLLLAGVVHTAAAMAVGAVATWSALAFA